MTDDEIQSLNANIDDIKKLSADDIKTIAKLAGLPEINSDDNETDEANNEEDENEISLNF